MTVAAGYIGEIVLCSIHRRRQSCLCLIEKLTLNIPWMSLGANPTRVDIAGLYILIVPKNGKSLVLVIDQV